MKSAIPVSLLALGLALCISSNSSAQDFEDLRPSVIWEFFDVYYSLDPQVNQDYFVRTAVPLTSLQEGDGAFALFEGERGGGLIVWFDWLKVTGILATEPGAVWGPIFVRYAEGGAWDRFGWPMYSMQHYPAKEHNNLPDGRMRRTEAGYYASFSFPFVAENTIISHSAGDEAYVIEGDILNSWGADEGGPYYFGWPTSDARPMGTCTLRQDFSFAYICERFGTLRWYYLDGRRLR